MSTSTTIRRRRLERLIRELAEAERYASTLTIGSAENTAWVRVAGDILRRIRAEARVSNEPLHPRLLQTIRHTLGVTPEERGSGGYRNRYTLSRADLDKDELLRTAVVDGYLVSRDYDLNELSPDVCLAVTKKGATAAGCLAAYQRWEKSK
jgi:hypothetical protein